MNKLRFVSLASVACIVVLLFAAFVSGQAPARLLKLAEKGVGGSKAFLSVRSTSRVGRIARLSDGATGKFKLQTAQPNFYKVSYDIAGFETEFGYNGRSAWARDSKNGVRTLTGKESTDLQAEAAYRNSLWFNAKREKTTVTAGSRNSVVLNTAKGPAVKLWIDPARGNIIGESFPVGGEVREFKYEGFTDRNGVSFPTAAVMTFGGEKYRIEFDDITVNEVVAKSEFDFPRTSSEPLPDIRSLLTALQANEDRIDQVLDTYSFTRKITRRVVEKEGTFREAGSETFRLSFYKGYRISRLIEKDGKPLNADDQKDADRDAQKRVEEIEKLIAKQESKTQSSAGGPSEDGKRVSVAEVLRASKLLNPRRERFRGRDVIVFDFEPNPDFDYRNARSMLKFFGKTAGVMWIDERDKQVARLEAYLADSFKVGGGVVAKLKKGASFVLEQERVNDEIWLPSTEDINLSVRFLLVKGIDVNAFIRSYDYRKFTTEVKDATVNEVKNP